MEWCLSHFVPLFCPFGLKSSQFKRVKSPDHNTDSSQSQKAPTSCQSNHCATYLHRKVVISRRRVYYSDGYLTVCEQVWINHDTKHTTGFSISQSDVPTVFHVSKNALVQEILCLVPCFPKILNSAEPNVLFPGAEGFKMQINFFTLCPCIFCLFSDFWNLCGLRTWGRGVGSHPLYQPPCLYQELINAWGSGWGQQTWFWPLLQVHHVYEGLWFKSLFSNEDHRGCCCMNKKWCITWTLFWTPWGESKNRSDNNG